MYKYSMAALCLAGLAGILLTGRAVPASPGPSGSEEPVWSRGLTGYLKQQGRTTGEDWTGRKQRLIRYMQTADREEKTLREYAKKTGAEPAAKAALVFSELNRAIGADAFARIVEGIPEAASAGNDPWDGIRTFVEKQTGRDLSWFFSQWIDRKGLPDLAMENTDVKRSGSGYEVSLDLVQKGDVYTMDVPVSLSFADGQDRTELVHTDSSKKQVILRSDREPSAVILDGQYEIARRLSDTEIPPLFSTLLSETKPLVVVPDSRRDLYDPLIEAMKQRGAEERNADGITDADVRESSILALGNDNPLVNRLYGSGNPAADFDLRVRKNPWNARKVVAAVRAASPDAVRAFSSDFAAFADFSAVSVDRQGRKDTVEDAHRGIRAELRAPAAAVELKALKTLPHAMETAAGSKIIYVGEQHDKFAHHAVQLDFIRDLYQKDRKLAIGMEMFQRPYQAALDDYISGAIDERTFLKRSEYFKRWVFDYNLYKPILDFARERKIPVIALNQKKEITEKVAKEGFDGLDKEERKLLPQQMDFSDDAYRDRLRAVFEQHRGAAEKQFDHFYQAQVLWDETMAWSIDEFLRKHPDHRMVVIAGGGHLAHGSGIPRRVFRRNGLPYFIALNDGEADPEVAHYLILPEPLEGVVPARLMVVLREENSRVSVVDLPKESVAGKAGIKAGDTLLALDGEKVESIVDIKIHLFYKKTGETVTVRVQRKGFFGDREMDLTVTL